MKTMSVFQKDAPASCILTLKWNKKCFFLFIISCSHKIVSSVPQSLKSNLEICIHMLSQEVEEGNTLWLSAALGTLQVAPTCPSKPFCTMMIRRDLKLLYQPWSWFDACFRDRENPFLFTQFFPHFLLFYQPSILFLAAFSFLITTAKHLLQWCFPLPNTPFSWPLQSHTINPTDSITEV